MQGRFAAINVGVEKDEVLVVIDAAYNIEFPRPFLTSTLMDLSQGVPELGKCADCDDDGTVTPCSACLRTRPLIHDYRSTASTVFAYDLL